MANLMTRDDANAATGGQQQRQPARRRGILDMVYAAPLLDALPELSLARAMMNTIGSPSEMAAFVPNVDVSEKDGNYVVEVALPGFRREDIDIEVSGNELTVTGKYDRKLEDGKKHYSEIRQASFVRTIVLPQDIKSDAVTASFEDGILRITAPPATQLSKKKVTIR
jgi:HSP20 family protein